MKYRETWRNPRQPNAEYTMLPRNQECSIPSGVRPARYWCVEISDEFLLIFSFDEGTFSTSDGLPSSTVPYANTWPAM